MIRHLLRRATFIHECQISDYHANLAVFWRAIDDPGVWNSRGCDSQKIALVRKNDTALAQREGKVFFVLGTDQASIRCRGHIDLPPTKSVSNRMRYVLVEMKTEHTLVPGQFVPMLI